MIITGFLGGFLGEGRALTICTVTHAACHLENADSHEVRFSIILGGCPRKRIPSKRLRQPGPGHT